MLRSKYHHPWQPRVSDGQLLNPSAHTTASETSFSDAVEEAEEQVHPPQGPAAAAPAGSSSAVENIRVAGNIGAAGNISRVGNIEVPEAVTSQQPKDKPGWYANLMGRFARKH